MTEIFYLCRRYGAPAPCATVQCAGRHIGPTHTTASPPPPYLMQPKKGLQRARALCRGCRGGAPYWDIIFRRNLITDFVLPTNSKSFYPNFKDSYANF